MDTCVNGSSEGHLVVNLPVAVNESLHSRNNGIAAFKVFPFLKVNIPPTSMARWPNWASSQSIIKRWLGCWPG